jgi:hypothetical protein
MPDEAVLRLYAKHCTQYKNMCAKLNGCCAYINRHWLAREYHSGRRDLLEIGAVRYFTFFFHHNFINF